VITYYLVPGHLSADSSLSAVIGRDDHLKTLAENLSSGHRSDLLLPRSSLQRHQDPCDLKVRTCTVIREAMSSFHGQIDKIRSLVIHCCSESPSKELNMPVSTHYGQRYGIQQRLAGHRSLQRYRGTHPQTFQLPPENRVVFHHRIIIRIPQYPRALSLQ
jgi:hypothetical protein